MIVVTGGSGKAGRACIQDLLAHQYEVASVDLARPSDSNLPFSRADLTDFGQTVAALSGIDERVRNVTAVVHLAAIPAPGLATNAGYVRNEYDQYLQRIRSCAAARNKKCGLGIQRDRARLTVRQPSTLCPDR